MRARSRAASPILKVLIFSGYGNFSVLQLHRLVRRKTPGSQVRGELQGLQGKNGEMAAENVVEWFWG